MLHFQEDWNPEHPSYIPEPFQQQWIQLLKPKIRKHLLPKMNLNQDIIIWSTI